jgi:hypothetical protein
MGVWVVFLIAGAVIAFVLADGFIRGRRIAKGVRRLQEAIQQEIADTPEGEKILTNFVAEEWRQGLTQLDGSVGFWHNSGVRVVRRELQHSDSPFSFGLTYTYTTEGTNMPIPMSDAQREKLWHLIDDAKNGPARKEAQRAQQERLEAFYRAHGVDAK